MHVKKACIPKPVTAISDDAVQGLKAGDAERVLQAWRYSCGCLVLNRYPEDRVFEGRKASTNSRFRQKPRVNSVSLKSPYEKR